MKQPTQSKQIKPKKKKKTGWIVFLICIIVIALIVAVVALLLSRKKEEHRVVKIDEHQGEIVLFREENEIDLSKENRFRGMNLQATDAVETGEEAHMVLLVDSDKYIYADEDSKFSIVATGNAEKGRVKIQLEYGAALCELENKLPPEAIFEVETPNATASVRGTTFGVHYDEEKNETKVQVIEGVVEVNSDGGTQTVERGEIIYISGDDGIISPVITFGTREEGDETIETEENDEYAETEQVGEFDNVLSIMERVVLEKTPNENSVDGHPILDDTRRREYIVVYSGAAMMFGNGEGVFIFESSNGASNQTMERISQDLSNNFNEIYGNINVSGNSVKISYKQIPDFGMDIIKEFCVDSEDYLREITFEGMGITEESGETSEVMSGIMDYMFDFKVVESTPYDFYDGLGLIK